MRFLIALSSLFLVVAVNADSTEIEEVEFCDPWKNLEPAGCKEICPITCGNIHLQPLPCPLPCITPAGCRCRRGYVRDFEGNCIKPWQCRASCKADPKMEWDVCGDRCPKFCGADDKRPCPLICGPPACACKREFTRSFNGNCITNRECGVCKGDRNAVISPCGDPCPITCKNLSNPPVACPAICLIDGCKCKPGFVLNEDIGKCVAPEDCPPEFCDPWKNLMPTDCRDICPITCDNIHLQPLPCKLICITPGGCMCRRGYVRDSEGNCIRPWRCPRRQLL